MGSDRSSQSPAAFSWPLRVNARSAPGREKLLAQKAEHVIEGRKPPGGSCPISWRFGPDEIKLKELVQPVLKQLGFPSNNIKAEFFAEGYYNRLYLITSSETGVLGQNLPQTQCLLRVPLSVYPFYKTESELATNFFLRKYTSVPVPQIYAFDSSTDNCIGFEWMLMEKAEGIPYGFTGELSGDKHKNILKTLNQYLREISSYRFDKIGSLYCDWDQSPEPSFFIGPMVNRCLEELERGPFSSTKEYVCSHIRSILREVEGQQAAPEGIKSLFDSDEVPMVDLIEQKGNEVTGGGENEDEGFELEEEIDIEDQFEFIEEELNNEKLTTMDPIERSQEELNSEEVIIMDSTDSEDEPDERPNAQQPIPAEWLLPPQALPIAETCHSLLNLFDTILPSNRPLHTTLYHHDLHEANILVSKETGTITAILDWEMTAFVPSILLSVPRLSDSITGLVRDDRGWGLSDAEIKEMQALFSDELERIRARDTGSAEVRDEESRYESLLKEVLGGEIFELERGFQGL